VQWDRGIPQAQLHRAEDMPRKPVAGKARRRIGHWGDPLPNDDDEPPGERGRSGKPSCRTARRPKAGGKRSAQPGTGEGVRIEARRDKTWQLHHQGLIHESRLRRCTHDQFNPRCCFGLSNDWAIHSRVDQTIPNGCTGVGVRNIENGYLQALYICTLTQMHRHLRGALHAIH
jgi:hypothetical protein